MKPALERIVYDRYYKSRARVCQPDRVDGEIVFDKGVRPKL
jgi:hypothetical protein